MEREEFLSTRAIPESLRTEELVGGDELWTIGRTEEALELYQKGFNREDLPDYHFTRSALVKRIVDLLLTTEGPEAAKEYYGLQRVDDRDLIISPDEIVCISIVREEGDQLPFFLDYYEALGVRRVERWMVSFGSGPEILRGLLVRSAPFSMIPSARLRRGTQRGSVWPGTHRRR